MASAAGKAGKKRYFKKLARKAGKSMPFLWEKAGKAGKTLQEYECVG